MMSAAADLIDGCACTEMGLKMLSCRAWDHISQAGASAATAICRPLTLYFPAVLCRAVLFVCAGVRCGWVVV
jgi:hypothetical protein